MLHGYERVDKTGSFHTDWGQELTGKAIVVIVIMGVSGAGKTAVGTILAEMLGAACEDGDDFHPPANVEKMRHGIPLNDEDRAPWLKALAKAIDRWIEQGEDVVLSCSALKQAYRDVLIGEKKDIRLVYLKGDEETIRKRIEKRRGHFFDARLLANQFAILEEPSDAITVAAHGSPRSIASAIYARLRR